VQRLSAETGLTWPGCHGGRPPLKSFQTSPTFTAKRRHVPTRGPAAFSPIGS